MALHLVMMRAPWRREEVDNLQSGSDNGKSRFAGKQVG